MKTKLSTKGQVILPKAIRDECHWKPGTELSVERRADGVLLRPVAKKKRHTIADWAGVLKYKGPPHSIEEMNAAIVEEVRRRHARGRY
ncbi:MAG: AbrB/MazE/SpoVT family DNA-binding domain-containing protein [Enhydrobacter sp.]|nr:MAG: AbrB/MazE/SpoVT family DNA-binding domain-containing protein [Enhydrobacter sp.]